MVDGTNGQNALAQVAAFDTYAHLTGLIVTKLDGTAKGGVLAAITAARGERRLPIYYIGVGENSKTCSLSVLKNLPMRWLVWTQNKVTPPQAVHITIH